MSITEDYCSIVIWGLVRGLCEVKNPSEMLLSDNLDDEMSGFAIFLNIAGDLKVTDSALDLAVVAVMSSNFDVSVPRNTAFAGEVGLSGEIRTVTRIEQRVSEAAKLGFDTIFIPTGNLKGIHDKFNIRIIEVNKVTDVFRHIFQS